MQLHGRLEQQEHTTEQHDQVASGEALVEHLEQRRSEGHHPRDTGQQAQAHDQRQRQADHPRTVALMGRQFIGEDGDEHQVIDTQYQFQHNQRGKAQPGRGVG
ncbi:hypothetical protein D3C75_971510 [compost metagenome]